MVLGRSWDIVFLDLEATVIDSWDNPVFIGERLKSLISDMDAERFGIFSFAIWSEEDRQHCIKHIVPMLEANLGIKIDLTLIPTKREMCEKIRTCGKENFLAREFMSFDDFRELWSKDRAFIDWIRASFGKTSTSFCLIDDMVSTCELWFPEVNIGMLKVP